MTRAKPFSELFLSEHYSKCLICFSYAVSELQKDVEKEISTLPESEREAARTKFAIFVVHNKLKEKAAALPQDVP